MDSRILLGTMVIVLIGACGTGDSSEDAAAASRPDTSTATIAASGQTNLPAEETIVACEDDSLPSEPFVAAPSADSAVLIEPNSRDTTWQYEVAMRVDRCGFGRGLVRRKLAGGPVEFIPFPEGFREALTTFDVSADDRLITFVEFDGEGGAFGVLRTFPEGGVVARSRRLEVPAGDTICGSAEFRTDTTWAAYVCAAVPGPELWVRLRASTRGGAFVEDTVLFALRRQP